MYAVLVNLPLYQNIARYPRRVRWFMTIAWVLIAMKCVLVWWAMNHWNVPFHPLWVIGPTLMFAALVTAIWATHEED